MTEIQFNKTTTNFWTTLPIYFNKEKNCNKQQSYCLGLNSRIDNFSVEIKQVMRVSSLVGSTQRSIRCVIIMGLARLQCGAGTSLNKTIDTRHCTCEASCSAQKIGKSGLQRCSRTLLPTKLEMHSSCSQSTKVFALIGLNKNS